jgi:hypothetical protein
VTKAVYARSPFRGSLRAKSHLSSKSKVAKKSTFPLLTSDENSLLTEAARGQQCSA